jgi:hypothetical protein
MNYVLIAGVAAAIPLFLLAKKPEDFIQQDNSMT